MSRPDLFSLDDFPVGCLVSDLKRQILYSNVFFEKRFGHAAHDLAGADLFTLLTRASQIIYDSYIVPLLLREGSCDEIRLSLVSRAGDALPVVANIWRDDTGGGRIYWSLSSASRAERMFQELAEARELLQQKVAQLHTLSDTDQLTGLANRTAMTRHLSQQMSNVRAGQSAFALAFIDLDGFKKVNDQHGHQMGDKLLRRVARRMASNLRSDDLIARFGGDEFVILMHGDFSTGTAEESLNRLVQQLAEPFEVDSEPLEISASVGVTLYPQSEEIDPDQLIRQADQAMYQAKLAGRNQLCLFNADREKIQRDRNEELAAIRSGLAAGEFELYYQPKINMLTGQVLGAEALLRWNHPVLGLTGPATFLAAVNDTPVGLEMGRWVIANALAQLQDWHRQGLELPVSINIAGYHLQHPDFLADLSRMLADVSELPKQLLELEVLETSTIEDVDQISSVITACKSLGIQVSLDDFGTGYSTLGHLRDLTVDTLKIDRSFVKDMLTNAGDLAILKGVIGFARAFECNVIAEGVETWQHSQRLIDLGCEWGQGFYIARPMPAGALETWVRDWREHGFHDKFLKADSHDRVDLEEGS
ncbi:diguanylate cyclase (GGDEF) domain-containing protein [Marinobacter daqiaonensis]|uniref:Diguanylate cyclase (GGDEF) domain-containing protein n=1 Tax=Marinobacter daqiaonensis TaxID=650891 RepID=A0A1I6JNR2_9GAMM|nr:EAL domain-containing protein [Marinobacter daqiaonensis]SFR80616.1 diguanylate cyclase (GGDEF) domain-containing protein [Marinobacter daqiaonensis]